jgi:DNA-binding NarL/FixJ family response regulator
MKLALVLVASNRPAVHTFFKDRARESGWFDTSHIVLSPPALSEDVVLRARLAVVDVASDPEAAREVCETLKSMRSDLPIVAIVCCPRPITPRDLDGLLNTDLAGLVDTRTSSEDMLLTMRGLAAGDSGLRLHVHGQLGSHVRSILRQDHTTVVREEEIDLLELVAAGLDSVAIGQRLAISSSAVNHRISGLCERLGVSNRQELAAWAAWYGLYEPSSRTCAPDVDPTAAAPRRAPTNLRDLAHTGRAGRRTPARAAGRWG